MKASDKFLLLGACDGSYVLENENKRGLYAGSGASYGSSNAKPANSTGGMTDSQLNQYARNLIVRGTSQQPPAVDMWQQIFTGTFTTGVGTLITVPLRNVGLVKRLLVKVTGGILAGAQNLTLAPLGAGNFWGQVVFTDFSNNQRINTTGWHAHLVSSAKRRRVFGAAYTTDTPCGYGNIFTATEQAPTTINNGTTGNFQHFLEVPLSYTDHDLRGALWANTTSATAQLQLTANPGMLVATGVDPTLAMYQSAGAAAGTLTTFTVTVYQNYLDQIPVDKNNKAILPLIDLSYAYTLLNTSMPLPVANQDNLYAYPNFRQFLSTALIYDNAGTLNIGTDINYFAIQSANFTNLIKVDPITAAFMTRNIIGDDCPKGMYYFDHRNRPIDTKQYGNITLSFSPSSVGGASATALLGLEALGVQSLITQAGSASSGS
jgi:hypothetical protein